MATNLTTYSITDGPTKNLLFDSLKYAYSDDEHITMYPTFSINSKMTVGSGASSLFIIHKINLKIVGIRHEDGSGKSFIFEGYVTGGDERYGRNKLVSGYYNARTKKGNIEIKK